jgi:hypothetical protein
VGEVELEQEAVVGGDAPVQGGDEVRARRREAPVDQIRQALGIRLAGHQSLQDGAATDAEDVAEESGEFQVVVLEGLLDSEGVLGDLPHELFAGAGEIA